VKIFLDTAEIGEIKKVSEWGILDGVTTNPSLLKKAVESREGMDIESYIQDICEICGEGKSVSLEVISISADDMIKEGEFLYKNFNDYAGNVYVKIPVNPSIDGKNNSNGLRAIKALSEKGIPINTTLIFTPEQSLLAAKAGASIVSPFVGRIDDYIRTNLNQKFEKTDYFPAEGLSNDSGDNGILSGVDLVKKTVELFKIFGIKTEVLAASLRNSRQVREVALAGAHISSMPFYALNDMLKHEKTSEGTVKFSEDTPGEYRKLFSQD
jgi:transaldolase